MHSFAPWDTTEAGVWDPMEHFASVLKDGHEEAAGHLAPLVPWPGGRQDPLLSPAYALTTHTPPHEQLAFVSFLVCLFA